MTVQEMRQAAQDAVVRAQALRNLITAENRSATDDENARFDAAMNEHDRFVADAAREERVAAAASTGGGSRPGAPQLDGTRAATTVHDRAEDRPFAGIGDYFSSIRRAGTPGHAIDPRLNALRAASGLNENGAPDEGGFLVTPDISTVLMQRAQETGIVYRDCDRATTGSNSMVMFGVDETSRVNGSRAGGVQAYWANEADTVTATKPKFRRIQLTMNKLFAICYATDELLEDSALLGQWIQNAYASEMGFKVDCGVIEGTGSGQPLGVLNAPALISVAKETSQTAATVNYTNVVKMKNRMQVASRMKSKWYVNPEVIPQLELMYLPTGSTSGVAAYTPESLTADGVPRLFGRPIVAIEQAAALGTVGDIIYADMSQYQILEKAGGVQAAQSMHVRFLYGENTFRFTQRIDGQPKQNAALTPYKGTATTSSFVALATRA